MKTKTNKIANLVFFISIVIGCSLILIGSVTIAGDEATVKTNKNVQAEKNNSPLLPVLVGGLIALIGSIGGGALVFKLQSRHEIKVFKRSKLEELTALAYQCDDWSDQLVLSYLVQGDISAIIDKFPINQMKMLQVMYFPTLKGEVQALAAAVKEFRTLIIQERKNLSATHEYSNEFQGKYESQQKAVLRAIEDLTKKAADIKT